MSLSSTARTVLPGREAGAVRDAKDVGIDRHRGFTERGVEDDVGGLAPDAGERLERLARARHFARRTARPRPARVAMMFFALLLYSPIVWM